MTSVKTLAVIWVSIGFTQAGEWGRFRGPNGTGISDAKTVPVEWTDDDYNWRVDLPGDGHASPIVVGDRIYVICGDPFTAERRVICLNTADGEVRWRRNFKSAPHYQHRDNNYASSTPTADSSGVVVTWATPEQLLLMALDLDGKEVWRRDLGPHKAAWGGAASPIIVDDLVVLMSDQMNPKYMARFLPQGTPITEPGKSFAIAVDRATGKTSWKIDRKSIVAGYATPCVRQLKGGKRELVFFGTGNGMMGVDLPTGKVNWEMPGVLRSRTVLSPVLAGDLVLGSHGVGLKGDQLVAVRPGVDGEKSEVVYEIKQSVPLVPTPLFKDGLVFLWTDAGIVTCVKAESGEEIWRQRVGGKYYASPVWVDGRLYCPNRRGDVVVLAASEKYELLARVPLGEQCFATPAVSDGVMYFRTTRLLMAIGGK